MIEDILAFAGLILLSWILVQRLVPPIAEWRVRELRAWASATRLSWTGLAEVWKLHWQTYRKEMQTR